MSWREDLQRASLAILNGKYDDALRILRAMEVSDLAARRAHGHLEGVLDQYQGRNAEALAKMQATLNAYGENVNLLRDIMICQYHLKDMMGFRQLLARIETILNEQESKLSYRTLFEAELTVGKFLEEEGRLVPALTFYERALKRAEKPAHQIRALIQKSRWHAIYEPIPQLGTYYRELIGVSPGQFTIDLRAELEHSLMLMELRLIGADHAWQRFEAIENDLPELDRQQMIADFAEGVLSLDQQLRPLVQTKLSAFPHLEDSDRLILRLAQGRVEPAEAIHELVLLAPQLPWASYLRLLCICANRDELLPVKEELQRKIQLIVRSLDRESQRLWSNRLKQSLQAQEVRIDFSAHRRSMSVQGKRIDLSKKKIGLQLLEGLLDRSTISIDDAIRLLWQSSFSPEHYHRLRMSVHRLNTLVHENSGLGKIIEVDSQNVRLRPEVKLRPAEDGSDLSFI